MQGKGTDNISVILGFFMNIFQIFLDNNKTVKNSHRAANSTASITTRVSYLMSLLKHSLQG